MSTEAHRSDAGPEKWLLRLHAVGFTYPNGLNVLSGFDLSVAAGKIVAIVGPSGCGKSTLLSILAGLVQPESGQLVWNPDRFRNFDVARRRPLTLVFQRDTVLPWLTVEKNVGFGLRYLHLSKTEKRDRIHRLLTLAGLEDFHDFHPRRLSGGMRRRVAFLTGVAPYPQVLLLDEPFSGLDEPTRLSIHADVLSIVHELGITVLLITHDLSEAITLGDEVHVLTRRPGRVAAVYPIGLAHDRDVFALREDPAYHELYLTIWHELRKQLPSRPSAPENSGNV